jgi:hypothetical protein
MSATKRAGDPSDRRPFVIETVDQTVMLVVTDWVVGFAPTSEVRTDEVTL